MNQILRMHPEDQNNSNYNKRVQPKQKKQKNKKQRRKLGKNEKADIQSIVKIFSIIVIVFGIILIGKSVYALSLNKAKMKDNPQIETEKMGKEVTIYIKTEKPIKEFWYNWNGGEETKLDGDGTVSMSETIEIPNGNNILNITIVDYYGNKSYYKKQYIYQSTDVEKPKITIETIGKQFKIIAEDETKISYMTYAWNNETATRIDAEIDQKTIEKTIDVREGENQLTVIAVDGEDNKTTVSKKIIGDTKPTVTVTPQGSNTVLINAKDDSGISYIAVTVDGQTSDSGEEPINQKDVSATVPITSGDHTIKVLVRNINGLEDVKEFNVRVE